MRALIDWDLPWNLVLELSGRGVKSVRGLMGLSIEARENFLRNAVPGGFDLLVTCEQDPSLHETFATSGLGVIILDPPCASLEDLLPRLPNLVSALSSTRRGQVVRVAA